MLDFPPTAEHADEFERRVAPPVAVVLLEADEITLDERVRRRGERPAERKAGDDTDTIRYYSL